jgi:hypothetical protein
MTRRSILRMALLSTLVSAAVEFALAQIFTFKQPGPCFRDNLARFESVGLIASRWDAAITAKNVLFHFATITTSWQANLAGPARTFVAWPRTRMFTTSQGRVANLPTRPGRTVVSLSTSFGGLVLATKAGLSRTHMRTWRTGTSMTRKLAWMRTFLDPFPTTRLPA